MLFLEEKKNIFIKKWRWPGVYVPHWAFALVYFSFFYIFIKNVVNVKQSVKTLVKGSFLRRLDWVCSVCLCAFNGC